MTSRNRLAVVCILCLVVALLLTACGTATPTATPTKAAAATAVPTKAAAVTTAVATTAPATAVPTKVPGVSTGVTDKEILFGATQPLTGPVGPVGTAYTAAAQAWWQYINDGGGINGRKITLKTVDDAYSPPKAVDATKQLVEDSKVFLMIGSLGTAQQAAVMDYLNGLKVPQIMVTPPTSGVDWTKYPWTTRFQPSYEDESVVYAKYIMQSMPDAKVGVIYQNDDTGKTYLSSFKAALGAKAATMVVSEQSYETTSADISSQLQNIKSAGATLVYHAGSSKFAAQTIQIVNRLGWKPTIILATQGSMMTTITAAGVDISEGVLSVKYLKDPTDPQWANDSGMKLCKDTMAKNAPNVVVDENTTYAMTVGWAMTEVLKQLGASPTREGVRDAFTNLNLSNAPLLLPGIVMKTTPAMHYLPIRQFQLVKFTGGRYQLFGSMIDARAN